MTHPQERMCRAYLIAGLGLLLALAGCERPPVETLQGGYRGLGMTTLINPRTDAAKAAKNAVPEPIPGAPAEGAPASSVYHNIQVLKDLNVAQFARVMVAITQWVAPPDQSCNYCHTSDMASDDRYTKVVSRRMLQMVRHINSDWKDHVGNTGVTCYSCHRGNAVPQYVWFTNPGESSASGLIAGNAGKNKPSPAVGLTALPYDPFTRMLLEDQEYSGGLHHGIAGWQPHLDQADRGHLCFDDALLRRAGRELHLLPQHALICRMGLEHSEAHHRLGTASGWFVT